MKSETMKGDGGMNWGKVRLGDICEINMGKTPSRSNSTYWNGYLPWVSIADLKGETYITRTKECITETSVVESGIKVVPKNTLLYSFKLSIGKVAITGIDIYTNEAIVALPIKNKDIIDLKYLYWAIQNVKIDGIGDKAVMGLTLNKEKLKSLEIPLPPLPIQKRIAEILDAADALRRKDQELLLKYDKLAQAIFIDMFGDPVKNEKKWKVKMLGDLFSGPAKCGPFGSALKKEEYIGDGVPVWVMDNIQNYDFNENGCLFIAEAKYDELKTYSAKSGDIIISRAGTVGKMSVVNSKYIKSIISTNLIKISLDESRICPLYFVKLMEYFGKKIGRLRTGSDNGFTHMNTGVLSGLTFPLPPIEYQLSFLETLTNIQKQSTVLKTMPEKLFNSLLQQAFKGNLVK